MKEYLKINVIEFCRRDWRGEETESAVLHPTGIRPLLMWAEVMRTVSVFEVRRERGTPEPPRAGEKLTVSLDIQVEERGVEDGSNVLYLDAEESR